MFSSTFLKAATDATDTYMATGFSAASQFISNFFAQPYIKLALISLLPVIATLVLQLLTDKTPFGKYNYIARQVIYGVIFGILAIIGTEYGIPINGAQVNCRDAAVVTAGLIFGAPAGIIAGVIGAVERWIAVAWGVGTFTRVACSVSTLIAGFYAAALRKFLFDNKKPVWAVSVAVGVVIEVFHMTMVFLTNMSDIEKAMTVVAACSIPMITANGIAVGISTIASDLASRKRHATKKKGNAKKHISGIMQRGMLVSVLCAFILTSIFMYRLQDATATAQADSLLTLALDDVSEEIRDTSDKNLLNVTEEIRNNMYVGAGNSYLNSLCRRFDVAEINIVNRKGIIINSTEKAFLGYDMKSGAQSKEFMCLVKNRDSYVQGYGPISYDRTRMAKYAGVSFNGGFIQVGYDAKRFQKDVTSKIDNASENRHVGQTGYILILDNDYKVISAPKGFKEKNLKDELGTLKEGGIAGDERFNMTVGETEAFGMYRLSEGYYIISVLPTEEALKIRNIALYVNTFLEILVFAVMFVLIYVLVKRVIVTKLTKINASLSKISSGDLEEVIDVRTNAEFDSLSDDINSTVSVLKHYIEEAKTRIDKELEFAKSIQVSALPGVFPAFPQRHDFDIYARMDTAKEVGGDFYDLYMTGGNTLNFLIADVSGKGIPAAMFMMRAKTELKSLTDTGLGISDVFTKANNALCEGNDAGMFVTGWQAGVDLKTGLVKFANAGHNPPVVYHTETEKFEYLKARAGFVLAGMEGVPYKEQQLELRRGDIIFLYTDGVTEATDANNELYGEERLLNILNSRGFDNMKDLCDTVKEDVDKFVGEAPQFDDITMLAFKYEGEDMGKTITFENPQIDNIPELTAFIEEENERIGCPMKASMQINIAVDEIYSNIAKFAYKDDDENRTASVTIKEIAEPKGVSITFVDHGEPYNPLKKSDPDITLSAEEREIGGLGIFMVKKTMDDMKYSYENDQNMLTIIKYF